MELVAVSPWREKIAQIVPKSLPQMTQKVSGFFSHPLAQVVLFYGVLATYPSLAKAFAWTNLLHASSGGGRQAFKERGQASKLEKEGKEVICFLLREKAIDPLWKENLSRFIREISPFQNTWESVKRIVPILKKWEAMEISDLLASESREEEIKKVSSDLTAFADEVSSKSLLINGLSAACLCTAVYNAIRGTFRW